MSGSRNHIQGTFGDAATHTKTMRYEFNNEGLQQKSYQVSGMNADTSITNGLDNNGSDNTFDQNTFG